MKVCSKCKEEKGIERFSKNKSNKDGMQYRCKSCVKEHNDKKRDDIAAYGKAWRSANIDYKRQMGREYAKENPHIMAEWRAKNKDHLREYGIRYREENSSRYVELMRAWREANKVAVAGHHRARRARKAGAEGSHTYSDINAILESQRGLCANCSVKLSMSGDDKYHVDHIQPLSKGGSNDKYNLQCLCPACNLSKGAKDPEAWAQERGKLI